MDADEPSVFLHSRWSGIVLTNLGALILIAGAIALAFGESPLWVVLAMGAAGLAGLLVIWLDQPIATEFTFSGVTRRMVLRHQHLGWSDITRLDRQRVGVVRTQKGGMGGTGGFIAHVAGRKVLLVDVMESLHEYEQLRSVIGRDTADRVGLGEGRRPPDGRSPTWLYRRKRWRPGTADALH